MIFSKKWLKDVHQRSEEEKKFLALMISLSITIFIIIIWVMTLMGTIRVPEIDFSKITVESTENQSSIIESLNTKTSSISKTITNFFKGEETYVID